MSENAIEVKILEKEYLVACPPDAHRDLEKAAKHLDVKMREIRNSGKVHGTERIAVMAALNITYDLLQNDRLSEQSTHLLADIEAKLDLALEKK